MPRQGDNQNSKRLLRQTTLHPAVSKLYHMCTFAFINRKTFWRGCLAPLACQPRGTSAAPSGGICPPPLLSYATKSVLAAAAASMQYYQSSETQASLLVPCGPSTRKLPDVDDSRSDTFASVLLATGDRPCSPAADAGSLGTAADGGVAAAVGSPAGGGSGGSAAPQRSSLFLLSERSAPRPPVRRGSTVGEARFSRVVDGDDSASPPAAAGRHGLCLDSLSPSRPAAMRLLPYGCRCPAPAPTRVVHGAPRLSAVSTMYIPVSSLVGGAAPPFVHVGCCQIK